MEKESISIKIRSLRETKKVSLKEASKEIGISPSYLSQLENGEGNPCFSVLLQIAKYYGISVINLMSAMEDDKKTDIRGLLLGDNYTINGEEININVKIELLTLIDLILQKDPLNRDKESEILKKIDKIKKLL